MRLLVTGSAVRGLPVVTIGGGEDVAEVRDVIYNPEAGRIVGLTLNKRGFLAGRRREVLPAETIHAIGRDAVMVADETSLTLPEDAPSDVGAPPSGRDVTGDEVLTEGGTSLGKVRDVVILAGSKGDVVGYEIETASGGTATSRCPPSWPCWAPRWLSPRRQRSSSRTTWSGWARLSTSSAAGWGRDSDQFAAASGRKVVSRASAEELGKVAHIVVDVKRGRVASIVVSKGRKDHLVAWEDVSGFGPDAVMVTDERALLEPRDDREGAAASGKLELIGKRALERHGQRPRPGHRHHLRPRDRRTRNSRARRSRGACHVTAGRRLIRGGNPSTARLSTENPAGRALVPTCGRGARASTVRRIRPRRCSSPSRSPCGR